MLTATQSVERILKGVSCAEAIRVLLSDDDGWNCKHSRVCPVICHDSTEFLMAYGEMNDVLRNKNKSLHC
jgi:hypothetical protein